jgi:hypothetical protein
MGRAPKVWAPGRVEGWEGVEERPSFGGETVWEGVGVADSARGAVVGAVGAKAMAGARRKASRRRTFRGGWKGSKRTWIASKSSFGNRVRGGSQYSRGCGEGLMLFEAL